ncbi:MAG TPA: hypothetical protein VKA15_24160, partial [Isosphaeraceae bacterium]|nr:hypothetical protein [Isosphaeraceae bacterium]
MIPVMVDYASPSVFESTRNSAIVGLAANARRPVRFHGRVVQNLFTLRIALRALGEVIWSDDAWFGDGAILDPVVTVHPDRLFFEAFSQDQSAYGLLIVDPAIFETEGDLRTGTTNVDFTAWLWAALGEMRSSRQTWFRVEAGGFEVRTVGAGGRFEQKVELPDAWVRGFLQLQGAMALPGTRVRCRPVDLLAAIRYLRFTKARVSPRALRYEFEPDRPVCLVLEPWEHPITLRDANHNYTEPRTIRTWGRRRLRLIEPLLPFAESVDIYLKGRALPSFYAVKLAGMTFVLGLTGWSSQKWTETASFDLSTRGGGDDPGQLARAGDWLAARYVAGIDELSAELGITKEAAARLLERLCRQGKAVFDVESRRFRHRELFESPIDEAKLYPPDVRRERMQVLLDQERVHVKSALPRETVKTKKLKTPDGTRTRQVIYRDWQISGSAGDQKA